MCAGVAVALVVPGDEKARLARSLLRVATFVPAPCLPYNAAWGRER